MTQIAVHTIKTNLIVKLAVATIVLCVLIDERMSAAPQEVESPASVTVIAD